VRTNYRQKRNTHHLWKEGDRILWRHTNGTGFSKPIVDGTIGYIMEFKGEVEDDFEMEFGNLRPGKPPNRYSYANIQFVDRDNIESVDAETFESHASLGYVLPADFAFGVKFDYVFFFLPKSCINFSVRNCLYTAMCCARKEFTLITHSKEDLEEILKANLDPSSTNFRTMLHRLLMAA